MTDMIFVGLKEGKRISLHPDDQKERVFAYPKNGKTPCHVAIGEYLVKYHGGSHFMTSSSVNHPHEYGFKRSFDVSDVMGKARAYAFEKIAVRIEPGPLGEAVKTLEAAAKKYGRFPMPILFLKSSRKRKDALLVFKDSAEFEQFLSGLMYGSNLAELYPQHPH